MLEAIITTVSILGLIFGMIYVANMIYEYDEGDDD